MKRIFQVIGIVVVVLLAVLVALPFLINANDFRPALESELTAALGREVKVGDLKLAIFSGGVSADDLSIADDPAYSRDPFVRAKSLSVRVDLLPLILSREVNIRGIIVDQPVIVLLQSPSGEWNFSKLGASNSQPPPAPSGNTAGTALSVKLLKITGGSLSLGKTGGKAGSAAQPLMFDKVNMQLSDFSPTTVMPFSLSADFSGGGEFKVDGKAGPINSENVALTPVEVSLKISHLDLAASGVINPATGIAGLVSVDGNVMSDGPVLKVNGRVEAEQLKLVKGGSPAKRPVELDFALAHNLKTRSGSLSRGGIHIGKAEATLTGTYRPAGDSTMLSVNLSGPNMPVPALEAMLPALNIVLPDGSSLQGGTASVKMAVEGPMDQLIASGFLGLSNTRLGGFDLGSKLSAIEKLAGIKSGPNTEIETLSTDVRASQSGGEILQNIKMILPAVGELTGAGSISPANALEFRLTANVHATGGTLAPIIGHAQIPPISIAVKGTAAHPIFEPDIKGLASEEVKSVIKSNAGQAVGNLLDGLFGKKPK